MSFVRQARALPRGFWVLVLAMLVNRAGMMVHTFLALYVTTRLGHAASTAGAILGLYGLGAIVSAPATGRLSDRLGAVGVMAGSLFASGALLIAMSRLRAPIALMIGAALLGIAIEAFRPASLDRVAQIVPAGQRPIAYGVLRLAQNAGSSIGPALGGVLAAISFPALFWVDALSSLLAAGMIVGAAVGRAPVVDAVTSGPAVATARIAGVDRRARRRMWIFVAVLFPVLLVYFQHVAALSLFMVEELGLSEATYGIMLTLNTILVVGAQLPLTGAIGGWPYRKAFVVSALLCAAGFGGLALADGIATVAVATVVWTAGEMVLFPAMVGYVTDAAPRGRQGEYLGWYAMINNVAIALGSWLGTWAVVRLGGTVFWAVTLGLGLLSAALAAALVDPRLRPVEAP